MEEINVKVIIENKVKLPKYMTYGSAGMDVCAFIDEEIVLKSFERILVPTGIKMEIPHGYEIQVRPRSGLAYKHGISMVNTPGTIDSDYRGEIKIILINYGQEDFILKPFERIGQFVLQKVYKANLLVVEELNDTNRSAGGFGHTGNK